MFRIPSIHIASRLTVVTGFVAALAFASVGTAAAEDFEEPVVFSVSNTPNCISVNWTHSGSGVNGFSVQREQPYQRWDPVNAAQRDLFVCGMEPSTTYHFEVCAYFITEEGDTACGSADLRTGDPQPPQGSQRPPAPRIVDHHVGETFLGVKWDAGFEYDSYFVNYSLKGQGPKTIHHDDDGTWGYQRIDGLLPSRTYVLQVQGCTETFFGIADDHCWDWSAPVEVTTLAYPQHSGPDTCAPGFVWREAFEGDHVCVTPARRDQVKADNAQASGRREFVCTEEMLRTGSCPFTAPDTCKQGFVWREARPSDHVCVTPAERELVGKENATANERLAVPR
jgi:hypothetical protein